MRNHRGSSKRIHSWLKPKGKSVHPSSVTVDLLSLRSRRKTSGCRSISSVVEPYPRTNSSCGFPETESGKEVALVGLSLSAKTSECWLDNLDGNQEQVLRLFLARPSHGGGPSHLSPMAHFLSRLRRDLRFSKWTGMVGQPLSLYQIMKNSFLLLALCFRTAKLDFSLMPPICLGRNGAALPGTA